MSFDDYYWRDYFGNVPKDAVPGGKLLDGCETYIGQVLVKNHGLIVVQVHPGVQEVEVAIYGIRKICKGIKILCSHHHHHLQWKSVSTSNIDKKLIINRAVIGGLEGDNLIYIGRISKEGGVKIGKVINQRLYFVQNCKEEKVESFEVLVIDQDLNHC